MTTITASVPARARDLLASEWIKLRSVRSTYLILLVAAAAAVGVGYLVAHSDAIHWATMTAQARAAFDPVGDSFAGLGVAQLAFGALGVLAISSEYTTGVIRTTFAAAPRRRPVLAAKAAVAGAVSLLAGELIAFATFFTSQQALSAQHLNVALTHPGALRGVLAAGFYLAVMAWVGMGLGAVIRHTAGAITAMTGVVFLLPTIIGALPAPWNTDIGRFTVNLAAQQTIAQHPHPGYFGAGPSFLIVAGYAAAAIAAAAFLITAGTPAPPTGTRSWCPAWTRDVASGSARDHAHQPSGDLARFAGAVGPGPPPPASPRTGRRDTQPPSGRDTPIGRGNMHTPSPAAGNTPPRRGRPASDGSPGPRWGTRPRSRSSRYMGRRGSRSMRAAGEVPRTPSGGAWPLPKPCSPFSCAPASRPARSPGSWPCICCSASTRSSCPQCCSRC